MRSSTSLLRFLLATSSVAALMAAGSSPARACTDNISGNSSGFTNPAGTTINCLLVTNATVTGNVVNAGTITGSSTGMKFSNSTLSGSIINTGSIAGSSFGIDLAAGQFAGGISNSGPISAGSDGIKINGVSEFSGGIINSGPIAALNNGIDVSNVSTFTGGIANSGTMTITAESVANGISVANFSIFSGGIINSGKISLPGSGIGIVVSGSNFSGGIVNSGSLTMNVGTGITVGSVSTFSGGITNSGTITAGSFGIRVTGVTSFSGGITNSGSITAGSIGIKVSSVTSFGVTSFAGGITNSGSITAANTGINVAGVRSYSGGITNSGNITGDVGIVVAGAAPLTVSTHANSNHIDATFAGAIANSGNITGTGGTAIDLSAAPNAMTVNQIGGTITGAIKLSPFADNLNISGGTINGNIVGQGSTNTVNFALGAGTFTYGGPFSITGVNQINVNSGLVILDGTNSAGNVAINGGTLEVGDVTHPGAVLTATSGITIANGGTLAGHGTVIGNIGIPTGATLAPGGSIGTLNVNGNLSLAAGSFYQVSVTAAGASSLTLATGTATISGGTVRVIEQPGVYAPPQRFTILTANGGVAGTFTGATSAFAFLIPTLTYDPNDVFLTLTRNPTFFASQAQTPNQRAVGAALDASSLGSALVQALEFQTAASTAQAFDALSGEVHASLQGVLLDDSHYFRQAMLGRLRQADYAGAPDSMAALGFADPSAVTVMQDAAALAYGPGSAFPVKAAPAARPRFAPDVTWWSQGVGAWGQIAGDGNAAQVRRDIGGVFTGVDARFGEFRLGLAGGYTHASISDDARASSAGIDSAHLGGYAGTSFGALNLRGGAAYAFHTIDTNRSIQFPGFMDSVLARYSGGTAQVFGEAGYGKTLGAMAVEPFVGLAWVRVATGAFTEAGGAAALIGADNSNSLGYSSLGIRATTNVTFANGMALIPRAAVAWQHAFGDVIPTAALAFQSAGTGFTISGVPLAREAALVEAGFDLRINPHAKVGLSYTGELGGRLQDNAVKGNLTWNF